MRMDSLNLPLSEGLGHTHISSPKHSPTHSSRLNTHRGNVVERESVVEHDGDVQLPVEGKYTELANRINLWSLVLALSLNVVLGLSFLLNIYS